MGGKNAGVQAILRTQFMSRAIYIHCHVHRLNLIVADVCASVSYVCEFYTVDAKGLLVVVKEPMFVVTLFIMHKLLGPIKVLSDKIKGLNESQR